MPIPSTWSGQNHSVENHTTGLTRIPKDSNSLKTALNSRLSLEWTNDVENEDNFISFTNLVYKRNEHKAIK